MNIARNLFGVQRSLIGLVEVKNITTNVGRLLSWCKTSSPLLPYTGVPTLSLGPLGPIGAVRSVLNTPLFKPSIDYNQEHMMEALARLPPRPKHKPPHPLNGRQKMKGVILKLMILHPRKPNSGNRKCCKVRLQNGNVHRVHIPGVGHSLQEHNVVMVRQGKTKDISLKFKVVRGELDCAPVVKVRTKQPMVRRAKEE